MTTARQPQILSYADRLSVAPGESIEFKVSSVLPGDYQAQLVKLRHGDRNPQGPGFREVELDAVFNGAYSARVQEIDSGSCVVVDGSEALLGHQSFTLHALIAPTLPDKPGQTVLGNLDLQRATGVALEVGPEGVSLVIGSGQGEPWRLSTGVTLYPGCWYSIGGTHDPATGRATVWARDVLTATNSTVSRIVDIPGAGHASGVAPAAPTDPRTRVVIAAANNGSRFDQHFNGKVERPTIWTRVLDDAEVEGLTAVAGQLPRAGLAARWDFAATITDSGSITDAVVDLGPWALHGRCVNGPARGMTGHNWAGVVERFTEAPDEYAAAHFHDDDLLDCEWESDIVWQVPTDLPSGTYGLRITQGDEYDHLPFFVLPPRGQATADAVLVIPTASYLAYANEHLAPGGAFAQSIFGQTPIMGHSDLYLHENPDLGLSMYDLHSDGSGVHFSSSRRPIINLRPDKRTSMGGPWQFPADLHLIDWLDGQEITYDVITDLEVHQEGVELLARYKVVLTGSHPEYLTRPMMEAWEEYLATGGRAMYLGANGFYWVTNWHPEKPYVVEMRRGESGIRAWQAEPGELHLQTNGERGGLWRWRGRAPQKLVGVGFATQGFDFSSYYVQSEDATDPTTAFIFDGVAPEEKIGDFGLEGGGAAGFELDRYDLALGTPPGSMLLAHSQGLSDNYPRVSEEVQFTMPHMGATMDYQCRGDITYFRTRGDGAVFSVSSISWCGSLPHNEYDNNVSRITGNVLRRFLDPAPLELPSAETWPSSEAVSSR